MENHIRRMAHGDPRPAQTPSSRGQRSSSFQGFFNEGVVKHVTYVTDFCKVSRRVVYPSRGTTGRNFQFSGTGVVAALQPAKKLGKAGCSLKPVFVLLWVLVRLLLFHCMPAGRHSDSAPDSRRVRLCSRLPCGSYSAGRSTAVVCSRELVSLGNGGTLCCS